MNYVSLVQRIRACESEAAAQLLLEGWINRFQYNVGLDIGEQHDQANVVVVCKHFPEASTSHVVFAKDLTASKGKVQVISDQEPEALAQPEQEPVAVVEEVSHDGYLFKQVVWKVQPHGFDYGTKFYTTPPQPKEPEQEPVAWRAWFDVDNSAKWLFTLWPEEEHPSFDWQPLYTTPPQRKPCTWKQTDDIHMPDTWEADCGAVWTLMDGGPKDNDMHHCPKCGNPITEASHGIKE